MGLAPPQAAEFIDVDSDLRLTQITLRTGRISIVNAVKITNCLCLPHKSKKFY